MQFKQMEPADEVVVFVLQRLAIESAQPLGIGQVSAADVPGAILTFKPEGVRVPEDEEELLFVQWGDPMTAPFETPEGLGVAFMLHFGPSGVAFETPAHITLPNVTGLLPNTETPFYLFNEASLIWEEAATLQATSYGDRVWTVDGGIGHFSAGAFFGQLEEYAVQGIVTNTRQEQLSGVRVYGLSQGGRMRSATTGSDGSYRFIGIPALAPSEWMLEELGLVPRITVAASRNLRPA